MRIAVAIFFVLLWLFGTVGNYAIGASGDLLLVIAVVLLLMELRSDDV